MQPAALQPCATGGASALCSVLLRRSFFAEHSRSGSKPNKARYPASPVFIQPFALCQHKLPFACAFCQLAFIGASYFKDTLGDPNVDGTLAQMAKKGIGGGENYQKLINTCSEIADEFWALPLFDSVQNDFGGGYFTNLALLKPGAGVDLSKTLEYHMKSTDTHIMDALVRCGAVFEEESDHEEIAAAPQACVAGNTSAPVAGPYTKHKASINVDDDGERWE
jgi:hypothetical protein